MSKDNLFYTVSDKYIVIDFENVENACKNFLKQTSK